MCRTSCRPHVGVVVLFGSSASCCVNALAILPYTRCCHPIFVWLLLACRRWRGTSVDCHVLSFRLPWILARECLIW
jgi:hypothetical protein